jgi:hypothetical protein
MLTCSLELESFLLCFACYIFHKFRFSNWEPEKDFYSPKHGFLVLVLSMSEVGFTDAFPIR